jgi:hypothetical protein
LPICVIPPYRVCLFRRGSLFFSTLSFYAVVPLPCFCSVLLTAARVLPWFDLTVYLPSLPPPSSSSSSSSSFFLSAPSACSCSSSISNAHLPASSEASSSNPFREYNSVAPEPPRFHDLIFYSIYPKRRTETKGSTEDHPPSPFPSSRFSPIATPLRRRPPPPRIFTHII